MEQRFMKYIMRLVVIASLFAIIVNSQMLFARF